MGTGELSGGKPNKLLGSDLRKGYWKSFPIQEGRGRGICKFANINIDGKFNKLSFKVESFTIGDNYDLTVHEEKDWNASSSTAHSEPLAVQEVNS